MSVEENFIARRTPKHSNTCTTKSTSSRRQSYRETVPPLHGIFHVVDVSGAVLSRAGNRARPHPAAEDPLMLTIFGTTLIRDSSRRRGWWRALAAMAVAVLLEFVCISFGRDPFAPLLHLISSPHWRAVSRWSTRGQGAARHPPSACFLSLWRDRIYSLIGRTKPAADSTCSSRWTARKAC